MNTQFFNEEYEKCLLAIMILKPSITDTVITQLDKEAFYKPLHQAIYDKICKQWQKGQGIDLVSLSDDKISPVYLAELTSTEASTENSAFYIDNIQRMYMSRKIKKEVGSLLENVTPGSVDKVIENLETKLSTYTVKKSGGYNMNQLAIANVEQVQKAHNSKVEITGFQTGFENLDNIIDGFQKDSMYVIGARPSIGKTAFALSILTGIASKGVKTTVFSLEMSADSLYYRMLSARSNIPMWQIKKGLVMETEMISKRYHAANQFLFNLPITVFDSDIDFDKTLYAKIRYEARVNHSEVFVIDHLGLIEVSDSFGQRYVDVGRITKTLHKMAKELHICIIILAQCGREAEGKRPTLNLLRESGNIEQDADIIMLLYRQRDLDVTEEKEDPMKVFPTDVIVAKNRDGKTGTATFTFQPICMKFSEDKSGRSAIDIMTEQNDRFKRQESKREEIRY